jgi:hypothetical protein
VAHSGAVGAGSYVRTAIHYISNYPVDNIIYRYSYCVRKLINSLSSLYSLATNTERTDRSFAGAGHIASCSVLITAPPTSPIADESSGVRCPIRVLISTVAFVGAIEPAASTARTRRSPHRRTARKPTALAVGGRAYPPSDFVSEWNTRPTGPEVVGGTGCPSASPEVGADERTAPTPVQAAPEKAPSEKGRGVGLSCGCAKCKSPPTSPPLQRRVADQQQLRRVTVVRGVVSRLLYQVRWRCEYTPCLASR